MHVTYRFTKEDLTEILQKHLGLKEAPEVKIWLHPVSTDYFDRTPPRVEFKEITATTDELGPLLDKLVGPRD